jgi:hypothetical protein
MGTGYTRNDTANNIADGNVINASDLDGEFDAIQAAFNATTGHSHDGTTGEGPQIGTGGIADNAVTLGTKTTGNYVATGTVSGVGLSGSASAEGATFTVTSNATDANTASTIVARDASGNFSAGNVTVGNLITAGNVDGRDVSADGAKLDGIEAGATADQTASEILTLIKTVDGAGSGLDADTLDGVSSASFLRSDAADTKTAGDLSFSDNVKAIFGAGSDLQIYHDGSNSRILDAGTGDLYIGGDNNVYITNAGVSETKAAFTTDGAASLYYDNAAKLATTSSGIDVTGNITVSGTVDGRDVASDGSKLDGIESGATADQSASEILTLIKTVDGAGSGLDADTLDGISSGSFLRSDAADTKTSGDLSFADNVKAIFGAGSDLAIYHSGTNSIIEETSGAGSLIIKGTNISFEDGTGAETYATFVKDGAATIRYDNATKLTTLTNGVDITGTLYADGVVLGDNQYIQLGASQDLQIYHDGSNSIIKDNGTGNLKLTADGFNLQNSAASHNAIVYTNGGAVSLYHNNSLRINTTATGVDVSGDINSVNNIYLADKVYHEGDTDTYIDFVAANEMRVVTGGSENLRFKTNYIQCYENVAGSVETASKTGSVTPDMQNYNSFVWTLTGNITLANPSNEVLGTSGVFVFIHSGAGRTVSLGTQYRTVGGAGLTLSSSAGLIDVVPYFVRATGIINLGAPQLNFA